MIITNILPSSHQVSSNVTQNSVTYVLLRNLLYNLLKQKYVCVSICLFVCLRDDSPRDANVFRLKNFWIQPTICPKTEKKRYQ